MRIPLVITLKDDLIISRSSATSGGHTSLDYIPGSLLLGAVAGKLYQKLPDPNAQWDVFHSGKVRFLNGYPIDDQGNASFPMPLSYHYYKSQEIQPNALRDTIKRPNIDQLDRLKQPKQLRAGYITAECKAINTKIAASMKTAIESSTGRAAESQLFGYQAIRSGQRFLAYLEIDDVLEQSITDTVLKSLPDSARLGRSRSAQYGRVQIEKIQQEIPLPKSEPIVGKTKLTFWCLSDLALTDPRTGQPTLEPTPQHFGFTSGQLDISNSFIRTRCYSPYNAFRKAFDTQRQVISQGSIITLTDLTPVTKEQEAQISAPIGSYIESGLGQVLAEAQLCVGTLTDLSNTYNNKLLKLNTQPRIKASSQFIQWLQAKQSTATKSHHQWLSNLRCELQEIYAQARAFNALLDTQTIGVSASQWGEIRDAAGRYRHKPSNLVTELFIGDHAICRSRAGTELSWGLQYAPGQYLHHWFADKLLNGHFPIEIENSKNDNNKSLPKPLSEQQVLKTFKQFDQQDKEALVDRLREFASFMRTAEGQALSHAKTHQSEENQ